jgi:diguanylate cyclase (GGDEF)-like protein/PAS domain S-box-containing protein
MGLESANHSFVDRCLAEPLWPPVAGLQASLAQADYPIELLSSPPVVPPELSAAHFLELLCDGVFIARDGCFVFANDAFAQMLGYQREEFVGLPFERVIAPDFLSLWQHRFARRVGHGEQPPRHYRVRMLKKTSREEVWVELHVNRLVHEGRRGVLGTVRDITQRRRQQQQSSLRDHVLERMARGAGLDSVLHAIVFALEEVVAGMSCAVLVLNPRGSQLQWGAAPNLPEPLAQALGGLEVLQAAADLGLATQAGEEIASARLDRLCSSEFAALAQQAGVRACWSAPLVSASGQVLGCFVAYYMVDALPSASDTELLRQAASLAALAVERKRAEEELQLASLVYQTSTEAMMVLDAQNRILTVNPAFLRITGYVLEEVLGNDVARLHSLRHDPALLKKLCQELDAQGHWAGEVWSRKRSGESFVCWVTINTSLDEAGDVQRRVVLFSDITNRKQTEELVWRQANFDLLTQLPNRILLQDRLSQDIAKAAREGGKLALLSIDLDRFKEINDALGQDQGDAVLVAAARRIVRGVGHYNTVARMGSNEFVAIVPAEDAAQCAQLANDLLDQLAEPYQLTAGPTTVHASVGLAMYPEDATGAEGLLVNATHAMQLAKNQGGNQSCHFTAELQQAALARAQLVKDLREAVQQQQFQLHFQPIVDMASGEIRKAEALLRWQHPKRGMVNPAEFIPLAEETGLIAEIGNWVFHEATRWAKQWRERLAPRLQICINKSPAQFDRNGACARAWLEHLEALGLPGQAIVIEITEGLLLNSEPHVGATMNAYREAGVQLAIDDFGTGYSALSYLKKFDIDHLKIDQSFTRHLTSSASDKALCEAMVVMAHRLGLKVVAEGLETEEQRQQLLDMGCDCGQGYLYARPVPAEAFEQLLQRHQAALA